MIDDEVLLPWTLLAEDSTLTLTSLVLAVVEATDSAVRALGSLVVNLAEASGMAPEIAAPVRERAVARAYGLLDAAFRWWLAGLGSGGDVGASRSTWNNTARAILKRAADNEIGQSAPAAWVGREVRGRWLDAAIAERWFKAAVVKALPVDGDGREGVANGES
jgi:CRISPR system Cascade subunit CasA